MLGEDRRVVGTDATEMEEDQWAAVDQPGAVSVLFHATVSEVPVSHVIARVPQDQRIGTKAGARSIQRWSVNMWPATSTRQCR